jgi:hypothetical protein
MKISMAGVLQLTAHFSGICYILLYKHNHVTLIPAEGDVSVQGCLPALALPSSAVGLVVAVVVGKVAYLEGPSGAVVAAVAAAG